MLLAAPLGALVLFCLLATLGSRRGWPHPTAAAFFIVWLAMGLIALLSAWGQPEPTRSPHAVPVVLRSTIAHLAGALVFVGGAAAVFAVLDRSSLLVRSLAAIAAGVLSVPLALGVLFYLACMFDLGCV